MCQKDQTRRAKRSRGGSTSTQQTLGRVLTIRAEQAGRPAAVQINYDKGIWSGLSWASGENEAKNLDPAVRVTIVCSTGEAADVMVTGELYRVDYCE